MGRAHDWAPWCAIQGSAGIRTTLGVLTPHFPKRASGLSLHQACVTPKAKGREPSGSALVGPM